MENIVNNIYGLLKVKSFHGKDKHGELLNKQITKT